MTLPDTFAEASLEDVPQRTRQFAKLLFLDTLGVAVAGTTLPASEIAMRYARSLGANGGDSHVLGKDERWAPAVAAFANGVSAHALDYDDTSFLTIAHSSGSAVPAAVALGEEVGATGRDLLEAFVFAHEGVAEAGACDHADALFAGLAHDWHTVDTLGGPGCG